MSAATESTARVDTIEIQLEEQRGVIQSLFEAFKLLTEENAKKDKRIDKLDAENNQLKQLVSFHLVEGLENVRKRIEKMDKLEGLDKDVCALKQGFQDIKFALVAPPPLPAPSSKGPPRSPRSPSPQRLPPSLPFMTEPASVAQLGHHSGTGSLEKIQSSLDTLLSGLEYVGRQRNADVRAINVSLEKLDNRVKLLASTAASEGSLSENGRNSDGNVFQDIAEIKQHLIPELEHEWSEKLGSMQGRMDQLSNEIRKSKEEMASLGDRMIARDTKMAQLGTLADTSKRVMEKSEQLSSQLNNRLLKLESDIQLSFDEIRRVEETSTHILNVESKLDLSKAECRASWERVVRTTKQDVDGLRIKIERLTVVKEEYDRLSSEVRSLHDLVVGLSTRRVDDSPIIVADQQNIHPNNQRSDSPSIDPSDTSLSVMDEHLIVADGIVARLSAFPTILVPVGGAESGSLRVDSSSNRILWRIDNIASMIREPARYPKILVSPEFTATPVVNGKEGETLVGRMKLFPTGSDQSRIEGNCSFYLRCLPGTVVRYSVDIGGDVMDTFECSYEKQRDKGKHDFVKLNEYMLPDGSVTLGIEIKSVTPMQN